MSRRFEHTATYPCSPAALLAAYGDRAYWQARVDQVGGPGAELRSVEASDTGVDVALTQRIAAQHLPKVVQKISSGDLTISREEHWSALSGGRASARTSGAVAGTPAKITASVELTGDDASATVRTTGQAEVPVPLVGGKIEQAICDNITQLLEVEQRFTTDWVRDR
ncbi:DUF2505 domain-containing protein [Rhodococcus aerolatus]